jgi:hypothetical protein
MLIAALDGDGQPTVLAAKLEEVTRCLAGHGETSPVAELRERLSAVHECLSLETTGPGHDALWDLLETILEWAVRTCVYVDHLVGLQLDDPGKYRQFNQKTAETSRRLLTAALRGERDA